MSDQMSARMKSNPYYFLGKESVKRHDGVDPLRDVDAGWYEYVDLK